MYVTWEDANDSFWRLENLPVASHRQETSLRIHPRGSVAAETLDPWQGPSASSGVIRDIANNEGGAPRTILERIKLVESHPDEVTE